MVNVFVLGRIMSNNSCEALGFGFGLGMKEYSLFALQTYHQRRGRNNGELDSFIRECLRLCPIYFTIQPPKRGLLLNTKSQEVRDAEATYVLQNGNINKITFKSCASILPLILSLQPFMNKIISTIRKFRDRFNSMKTRPKRIVENIKRCQF